MACNPYPIGNPAEGTMPHEVTKRQLAEIKVKSAEWGVKDPLAREWIFVMPEDFARHHDFHGTRCRWSLLQVTMTIHTYEAGDGRQVDLLVGQCPDCGRVFWR
jgi:hypothetical protein